MESRSGSGVKSGSTSSGDARDKKLMAELKDRIDFLENELWLQRNETFPDIADGPGIPDGSREGIFNRMHKGMAKGMGIGLYFVRTLVEIYDGKVWVEDRVQGDHAKGARFVVMLPSVEM